LERYQFYEIHEEDYIVVGYLKVEINFVEEKVLQEFVALKKEILLLLKILYLIYY